MTSMDCIAAVSKPVGAGALAIVRLSGEGCLAIVGRLYRGTGTVEAVEGRGLLVGKLCDPETGRTLDQVVLNVYRAPGSYTGEDMVEICCHGGRYVPGMILEWCLKGGARPADRGEFTKRAFLNGKMDLLQAEAVAALIDARTRRANELAIDHLDKSLSKEVVCLRSDLLELMARLEYEIDFPGEEVLEAASLEKGLDRVDRRLSGLLDTWREGLLSREGVLVVIAGRPNVGKSSLFNLLARRERAIVTPHPGTTRDAIEQELSMSGLLVRLVDTAGLRESDEDVERIGVEVSRKYITDADIILFLVDAVEGVQEDEMKFIEEVREKEMILGVNKVDLVESATGVPVAGEDPVYLSARTGAGVDRLEEEILSLALGEGEREGPAILTMRQKRGLDSARAGIAAMRAGMANGMSPEYLAEDLRSSIRALEGLIGAVTSEEILDGIFSNFCVGK